MVIVCVSEVEAYCGSAAFVAVTSHEPAAVGVNMSPDNVQFPDTFTKVTAPSPEPPDVEMVRSAS